MRLLPFEPGHLALIRPGRFESLALEGIDPDALAEVSVIPGFAMSLADDQGRILGSGGVVPHWPGVGSAWLYASDAMRSHPVPLHRMVLRGLQAAETGLRLHRIQIAVHAEFVASRRWVERLGFHSEGLMAGFGSNGDPYIRYAKVHPHVRQSVDTGHHGRLHDSGPGRGPIKNAGPGRCR